MSSRPSEIDGARLKQEIERLASELGFDAFGVAPAAPLESERDRLRAWIEGGRHGTMRYLERLEAARIDPDATLPGARSVLCFAIRYGSDPAAVDASVPGEEVPIARYARGRDYHKVLRAKLRRIARYLEDTAPGVVRARACVDTAPLLEKAWAERAGLGWRGKHTNLVSRGLGSWFFLGEVLTTARLPADEPHTDFCGSCTRCLDACPTSAFPEPYVMDARRCISYLTIEHRGPLEEAQAEMIGGHVFGCDICLEVCPWNRFASPTAESDFGPREEVTRPSAREWAGMDDEEIDQRTRGTALRRAGVAGIRRNARAAAANRERP